MNEYAPWAALGQTETEYFRGRYIGQRAEIERQQRIIERLRQAINSLLPFAIRYAVASTESRWGPRWTQDDLRRFNRMPGEILNAEAALAYDGTEGES